MIQNGILFSASICLMISACSGLTAAQWYVDASVSVLGNGKTWKTAFKKIQTGIDAASAGDTVTVAEGTYVENIRFKGKNILLRSTSPLLLHVVQNTIIDGNKVDSVVIFGGTEDYRCVLSGFTIRNGDVGFGGGIRGGGLIGSRTFATIENNIITGNQGGFGGGLWGCRGMLRKNRIVSNSAQIAGGVAACTGVIQDNYIAFNTAENGNGGGLWSCPGTIKNNTILGNMAKDPEYAGYGNGGGLADCDGPIENNAIIGNSTEEGNGGGLADCDGTIQNNTIYGNSARTAWLYGEAYGGGLANCDGTIQCNLIAANTTALDGGGLFSCDGTIRSNVIAGNAADMGGGLSGCGATIENNTIADNAVRFNLLDGGGSGLYDCLGTIRNCIVWGNTGESPGNQVYSCSDPTFCCIEEWTKGGEGNIISNPRFVDADGPDNDPTTYDDNNYRLLWSSPCIDAGFNRAWMSTAVDKDGNARIVQGLSSPTVDMGAYEYRSFAFKIVRVEQTPAGEAQLTWNSRLNDTYVVWSRTSMRFMLWTEEATVPSQGQTTSWTDTAAQGQRRFYRIQLKP